MRKIILVLVALSVLVPALAESEISIRPAHTPEHLTFTAQVGCAYAMGGGDQRANLGKMAPGETAYFSILRDKDAYSISIHHTGNIAEGGKVLGKTFTVSATRMDLSAWDLSRRVRIVGSTQAVGRITLIQDEGSDTIRVTTETPDENGVIRSVIQHVPISGGNPAQLSISTSYGIRQGWLQMFRMGRVTFSVNMIITPVWQTNR